MRTAFVAVALLPLLLAACQSTVRTETRFLPPTSPEELACVSRCDTAERDCRGEDSKAASTSAPRPPRSEAQKIEDEQARRDYDDCSRRVQSEYEACEMGARTSGSRGSCYKPVCLVKGKLAVPSDAPDSNHDRIPPEVCVRIHEMCFKRCGGRIETQKVCEGNC